jgi:hypothetical protein
LHRNKQNAGEALHYHEDLPRCISCLLAIEHESAVTLAMKRNYWTVEHHEELKRHEAAGRSVDCACASQHELGDAAMRRIGMG